MTKDTAILIASVLRCVKGIITALEKWLQTRDLTD